MPPAHSRRRGLLAGASMIAVIASCGASRLVPIQAHDAGILAPADGGRPDAAGDTPQEGSADTDGERDAAVTCPATPLVGWGAVPPGTTGGAGGPAMTVTSYDALVAAAASPDTLTIHIATMIQAGGSTAPIRVQANKTIRGTAAGAGITGAGFNVFKAANVILQNLVISKAVEDAITVNQSHHVWIDHCDLSSDGAVSSPYDGLVDVNHGSDFVTVSWNHFHDHRLTSLVGHTAAPDNVEDPSHLKVTYHHNWFQGTLFYNPKVRYGTVHVFNNYYDYPEGSTSVGITAQLGADVLVEANLFKNVKTPMTTDADDSETDPAKQGAISQLGNGYRGTGDSIITRSGIWRPSPSDYFYSPDLSEAVPDLVSRCSGAVLE